MCLPRRGSATTRACARCSGATPASPGGARRTCTAARAGEIWEFPLPAFTLGGWSLPIAGGNYARQFPHWLMRRLVAAWMRSQDQPFLFYFHVWELDPDQPRIQAAPLYERIRQYRNLAKMGDIVRYYLGRYRFAGIADHLGLPLDGVAPARVRKDVESSELPAELRDEGRAKVRTRVSIVIPCFNEELILPYLANTLENLERSLGSAYDFRYVFVDDGSADGTLPALERIFGNRPGCTLLRHRANRGVAAAILTGIQAADTDVVCSIDCDCTYDPLQLASLIPLLEDGVDMVTASPYHPAGEVRNVPGWRLFLSKSLVQALPRGAAPPPGDLHELLPSLPSRRGGGPPGSRGGVPRRRRVARPARPRGRLHRRVPGSARGSPARPVEDEDLAHDPRPPAAARPAHRRPPHRAARSSATNLVAWASSLRRASSLPSASSPHP